MIPLKQVVDLAKAMPKARITETINGISIIEDANGERIGEIRFNSGEVIIYDDYQYADQVREAIGEGKFIDARKDFPIPDESPVNTDGEEPELTDYGESLYQLPESREKDKS